MFLPTPQDIVEKMLELAKARENKLVVDLGSGDVRFVITAAKKHRTRAIGYEIDARLVQQSRERIVEEGLQNRVRIEHADVFTVDFAGADVVTVFLYPRLLERLRPQFDRLKPGSRIVSHQFEIPGIKPDRQLLPSSGEDGEPHRVFLWTTPLKPGQSEPPVP